MTMVITRQPTKMGIEISSDFKEIALHTGSVGHALAIKKALLKVNSEWDARLNVEDNIFIYEAKHPKGVLAQRSEGDFEFKDILRALYGVDKLPRSLTVLSQGVFIGASTLLREHRTRIAKGQPTSFGRIILNTRDSSLIIA